MTNEKIKALWIEIYSVANWCGLTNEELERLVVDIVGKRAESENEVKKVLKFLRAVKKKLETEMFITTEDAIKKVKAEGITEDSEGGEAKVVEQGKEEKEKKEEKWDTKIKTAEGEFMFRQESEDRLICKNAETGDTYVIDPKKPLCSCLDFRINKRGQEWCKHIRAADAAGYGVAKIPEEVTTALAKPKKRKGRAKASSEEITVRVVDEWCQIPVQIPDEIIQNEDTAVKMIRDIIGSNPRYEDVIEKYGNNIEEINADVIISLAQYTGIQFRILTKETESKKINLGKIYIATETDEKKKNYYSEIADFMPETDVVTRCKITAIAAWKDKSGNLRVGIGTKEEHLTPSDLRDISRRGANFIETRCESKAFKKAILTSLPITHDGLMRKIKETYGWA